MQRQLSCQSSSIHANYLLGSLCPACAICIHAHCIAGLQACVTVSKPTMLSVVQPLRHLFMHFFLQEFELDCARLLAIGLVAYFLNEFICLKESISYYLWHVDMHVHVLAGH
jgi:hypothetical protein